MVSRPRIDLRRIAERLGISRQVVSAILGRHRGNVRYSRQTEQAVLAMAETFGYRPSQGVELAGIQILVSRSIHEIPIGLLDHLLAGCQASGVQCAIAVIPERRQPRPLAASRVAGWATLAFPNEDDLWLPRLADWNTPVLSVNQPTASGARIDFDDAGGMEQLVRWLHGTGRRAPAFLCLDRSRHQTGLRIRSFGDACRREGLGDGIVQVVRLGHIVNEVSGFLHLRYEIDALIVEHPILIGPLTEALRRSGRLIPQQVQPCSYFIGSYLRPICPHTICLDVRPAELAQRIIARCRALLSGAPAEMENWGYHLSSLLAASS